MLIAPFIVIEEPVFIVSVLKAFDVGVVLIVAGDFVYKVPAASNGISRVIPSGITYSPDILPSLFRVIFFCPLVCAY